jgi:hypothetical protein
MKKQILFCIAASFLLLVIGRSPASAGSLGYLMKAQIPFDFQVSGKRLPAGKYLIKLDPLMPQLLLIECPEQNIWVIVHTIPRNLSKNPARASLIFRGYDEKYFLSEVRVLGRGDGYALIRSKAERRLAQIAKEKTSRTIPNGIASEN